MLFHDSNGATDDILDTPTPTAMYVGNHPPLGLIQEHRLTVGDLNDEIFFVKVRQWFYLVFYDYGPTPQSHNRGPAGRKQVGQLP